MHEKIKEYLNKVDSFKAATDEEIENFRIKFLGRKGIVKVLMEDFKRVDNKLKPELGKVINELKSKINQKLETLKNTVKSGGEKKRLEHDLTRPAGEINPGSRHPVSLVRQEIIDIFSRIGFTVSTGPEIEDDWHNFSALNFPKEHPARDMQDTFYFKDEMLLRTHTSPVQIRTMLEHKPPIRMIAPGAVFRRDYDLTHTPMFHQVEGLVVDEEGKVSFANLKFILEDFLKYMFGDVDVRFRPSFFPFTEPSAEVDISCVFCKGEGCRVCSHTGWLEVLGCGIVDPNVFKSVKYKNVSGYAFGLGVERFAMLIHQIGDLRSLFEGDIKLLEQFQ